MKAPFSWDAYSDQPYQLSDRAYKKRMRKKEWLSLCITHGIMPLLLPFFALLSPLLRKRRINLQNFFALCIAFERDHDEQRKALASLPPLPLAIRIGLWQVDEFEQIKTWLQTLSFQSLLIIIMQDREHIDDKDLLRQHITHCFTTFSDVCTTFQIGTTINRSKWAFFSVREYAHFFHTCADIKEQDFPSLSLLAPSVIDFEYHFTLHALFTLRKRIDSVASLLYVDRRGKPENRQLGCNLSCKITLLDAMITLLAKHRTSYITETNWPLSNTAPYAPTSEHECVSEALYLDYMLRYYLLALATGKVERIYWHQLIAAGYGLIDSREHPMHYRDAFYAFSYMVNTLHDATFLRFQRGNIYRVTFQKERQYIHVIWTQREKSVQLQEYERAFTPLGHLIQTSSLTLSSTPTYIYSKEQQCAS